MWGVSDRKIYGEFHEMLDVQSHLIIDANQLLFAVVQQLFVLD